MEIYGNGWEEEIKKRRGTFEREIVRCEKFGYRDFFYYIEWKKKKEIDRNLDCNLKHVMLKQILE